MSKSSLHSVNKLVSIGVIAAFLPLAACAQPAAPAPPAAASQTKASITQTSASATKASDVDLASLNYLHTDGSKIVDANGNVVHLTGVSWFGMETDTLSPHGLWARNWESMLDDIVKNGFNTIRLPFSNELFDPNLKPMAIDYTLNPDLKDLNGIEVMDKIITGAGERGLKILLDRHRPTAGAQSKLWYTDEVSEEQWIADWQFLARRYLGNDTVIGADLHNEPAGDSTWGTNDPKTDWRLAAERAGNAILDINPHWLIVVEGIEKSEDNFGNVMGWYWMGGSLQWARVYPVQLNVPNQLVYSPHDYGPGVYLQGWFMDPEYPDNLPEVWDHYWGYLVKENIAPIILGEFGGRSVGDDLEGIWQRSLVKYLKENGMSYTYWSFNGNSGDTGGILKDDWTSPETEKVAMLGDYQDKLLGNKNYTAVDKSQSPTMRGKMKLVKGLHMDVQKDKWTKALQPELHVANRGLEPLDVSDIEMRYWFTADGLADRYGEGSQVVEISGVRTGQQQGGVDLSKIKAEIVAEPRGATDIDPMYYVKVTFGPGVVVPARDSLAVGLRISKKDGTSYFQENDYSRREYHWYVEWDRMALYQNGKQIWGMDPFQFKAEEERKEQEREQRLAAEMAAKGSKSAPGSDSKPFSWWPW